MLAAFRGSWWPFADRSDDRAARGISIEKKERRLAGPRGASSCVVLRGSSDLPGHPEATRLFGAMPHGIRAGRFGLPRSRGLDHFLRARFLAAFFLPPFFLRVAFFLADFFFAMALFPCLITTEPAAHLIETVSSSQQLFCDPTQIFYRLIVPCS